MVRVKWFSFDVFNFCRGYHFDRPKFNKRFLSIWKILYNLGHGILTQPAKCRHTDKIITFGCPSWMTFGHKVTFNREVKCFTLTCMVLFRFRNLQQPGEQIHMMPLPQEEQSIAQHRKDNSCVISVNETSPPLRYTGLENQGATCYLNTVLQMLFMTEEFREAVKRYRPQNCNSNINNHIAQLFECLKSGERNTATTERITAELKINVHKQEDAAKCLQKILNTVDPEISKIFQGKMTQITICIKPAKAHKPLKQVKTFFIISISLESLEDHINVQRCFESYFEPIPMCGEGQQIYCKECEMMMDTEMSCSLLKVPSVLVLHLERFEFDYDTMCCMKNHSPVQIPAQLSVKDKAGVNHRYDLYAIANHSGSLIGGHYYTDIRSFEDQQWYRFDDSLVDQMYLKCDLDNTLSSEEAYILLYKTCSGSTEDMFFEDNESERAEKRTKRANTRSQEDHPQHPKRRRDNEPENPHGNQQIEHTSTDTEDDHDSQSTAREEQDLQNLQNNSDFNSETENHSTPNVPLSPDHRHTEHTSTDTENQDQQNLQSNSGSYTETEANPSQPLTDESKADRGIQSPDADTDHQSEPNVPSSHDHRHTEHINIVIETHHDSQSTLGEEQDQQNLQNNSDFNSETENHSTPNVPSSPDYRHTEHISINTENDHDSQSTAREEQDQQNLQNNSDFNSETENHSTPNVPSSPDYRHTEHISINTENDHDSQSTAREEQDQQNLQNNSGSNSETEANPSQPLTDESTADRGIQSPDADTDHQSEPNVPSSHDYRHTEHMNIVTENDHDSQSAASDQQDQQDPLNNSDSETEAMLSQTRTDESTAEMQSNNGDSDNQSLINYLIIPSSADRVSEQNKCSDISVELEPLSEDSKTQSNMNIETRGACFTKRLICILSALLIVFLILIIIGVIISNNVK